MNGSIDVVLDHFLRDQDGVLEIIALPRHESHQDVSTQGKLALIGAGAVGQGLTDLHLVALANYGLLVEAGARIGAKELAQIVAIDATLMVASWFLEEPRGERSVVGNNDALAIGQGNHPFGIRNGYRSRIFGDLLLNPGSNHWCLGLKKGDGLTLHVGAHERPICIVMLEKRD